ncbi:MAG TPA: hypothetical protein DD640_03960, partial [Clostridiales bacterium]|nr:hypothetical protein [Clostridiales bacterium]
WVTKGEGLFRVAGQTKVLTRGEGLFCRRDVPHSYERTGLEFATLWVTFLGGEGILDYFHLPDTFFFRVSPLLSSSCADLSRLCEGSSTVVSRSAAGYNWLTEWLNDEFASASPPALTVQQYLETHFAEPITLADIGRQVHMDRYSLCRYIAQYQGVTVMEQLKQIRIAKAKQFLRHSSCSIEEVGRMCGYNSSSYFGKLFREATGRSPYDYRKQHGY